MAVVLSDAEELALFEILEVPYYTSYNVLSAPGSLVASVDISGAGTSAAKTAILATITTLEADVGGIGTKIQTLLQRWNTLGTTEISITGGSVGGITGVDYSYAAERKLITKKVQDVYAPYYRQALLQEKQMGGGGNSIPIIR